MAAEFTWEALTRSGEKKSGKMEAENRAAVEKRLKARRPQEFAFIAKVVKLVDQKKLPLKTVKTTYLWAMKKPRRRPFQYFERAMKLRAAKLKIDL